MTGREIVPGTPPSGENGGRPARNGHGPEPLGHGLEHRQYLAPTYVSSAGSGLGESIHIAELIGVLRRNWLLIVLLPFVTLGAGMLRWKPGPTRYAADAAVQILNVRRALSVGYEDQTSDRLGRVVDPIYTHIEIMRGRVVAGRAADQAGLRLRSASDSFAVAHLREAATDSTVGRDTLRLRFDADQYSVTALSGSSLTLDYGGRAEIDGIRFTVESHPGIDTATVVVGSRDAAVARVAGGINAVPRRDTDIVDVFYRDSDAVRAQRVVNAVVESHRQYSIEQAQDRSRRRREFLEQQLERADARLAEAQGTLTAFKSRNQLLHTSSQRASSQQQSLMDLNARVEELNAERRMARVLIDNVRNASGDDRARAINALVSSSGIGGNIVVASLYRQLAQYEIDRESLTRGSLGMTQSNPQVERLDDLIATLRDRIVDAASSHVATLDERAVSLDGLRNRSHEVNSTLPAIEAEEARLAQQVMSFAHMAEQLRTELQRADIAAAVEAGQVEIIQLAASPGSPITPRRSRQLYFAFMFGGILSVAGAFAREAMNTSVKRRRDIPEALQLTELAVVPRIAPTRNGRRPTFGRQGHEPIGQKVVGALAGNPRQHAGAEAYRTLRTNLIYSQLGPDLRTLIVTSAAPREGKSTTAVNMAAAFAQQGIRVLLIDADMRRPVVHRALGIPVGPGLSDVLTGSDLLYRVVRRPRIENLSVLPAGTTLANATELLGSSAMERLLAEVREQFELCILDTPPVLAAADAAVLAAKVDGAVFIVRAGKTETAAARQALDHLAMVRARVVGVVLNDPDMEMPKRGEKYYSYEYTATETK